MQLRFAVAKHAVDMVCQPAHHIQQVAFTGSLKPGHASLNHMPGAVQLVAFGQIGPARLGALTVKYVLR